MDKKEYSLSKLKVGLVVFFAIIVLLMAVFMVGNKNGVFSKYYTIKAPFPKVNGLVIGSPVWLSGFEVGFVHNIEFPVNNDSKNLIVVLKIREEYSKYIRKDSKAFIETKGLLGNKIISISIGSKGESLKEGTIIQTVPPLDITELVSNTTSSLKNLQEIIEALRGITTSIQKGEGSAGKLIHDQDFYDRLVNVVNNLSKFTDKINRKDSTLGRVLNDTELYDNTNKIILSANKGEGTIGKLLHDPEPFDKMNKLITRLDKLLAYIENGNGNVGKAIKKDEVYNEMLKTINETNKTLLNIQELIQDMKVHPQKYFKIKVF